MSQGPVAEEPATEAALTQRFVAGDPAALPDVVDRYAVLVHAIALHRLGAHHDAEDVTQEVFVRAWRGRRGFDPARGTLRAWLIGITRNQVNDRASDHARERRLTDRAGRLSLETQPGPKPDEVVDAIVVADELDHLPPSVGTVMRLAFFDDLTHQQIAAVTGMPLGTVKSRLRRGMQRLREQWHPGTGP
jgi:RNA polymerase sigma factor (sigma-70 family)